MLCQKFLSSIAKVNEINNFGIVSRKQCFFKFFTSQVDVNKNELDEDEFPPLELYSQRQKGFQRRVQKKSEVMAPRSASMRPDQDWPSVWPAPRTFHPATVPLPVRMGYPASTQPTPDKWANTELMKIPNFLHLTPPAVERHCAAIRKFCSPWPVGVSYPPSLAALHDGPDARSRRRPAAPSLAAAEPPADEAARESDPGYFPMQITRSTYLYSGPSVRDPRARVASIKVSLADLNLDAHSHDKLLRLVGDRYDRASDTLTIMADRCPLHMQNLRYCHYLLAVLRAEAEATETWENERTRHDHHRFEYAGSGSESAVAALRTRQQSEGAPQTGEKEEETYRHALNGLLNEDENELTVRSYSDAVLSLYGLRVEHDPLSTHHIPITNDSPDDLPKITMQTYRDRRHVVWMEHGWVIPRVPF